MTKYKITLNAVAVDDQMTGVPLYNLSLDVESEEEALEILRNAISKKSTNIISIKDWQSLKDFDSTSKTNGKKDIRFPPSEGYTTWC